MVIKAFPAEAGIEIDLPTSFSERAEAWLTTLPTFVADAIRRAFLSETSWSDPELFLREHGAVRKWFMEHSNFARQLVINPGTFEMLRDVIYRPKSATTGLVDPFLWDCSGGVALRSRHEKVVTHLCEILGGMNGSKRDLIRVVDLGSGPSEYLRDVLRRTPGLRDRLRIRSIDTDPAAIAAGNQTWAEDGTSEVITFQEFSFTSDTLVIRPEERAQLGVLVGVICGLSQAISVRTLRRSGRFLLPGATMVVSNVSEKILLKDPFTSWILRVIFGWKLVHKTKETLLELCRRAHYDCDPNLVFSDELGHHNMAVCIWRGE